MAQREKPGMGRIAGPEKPGGSRAPESVRRAGALSAGEPAQDGARSGWLLENPTDSASVARYYDEWAGAYDDELAAWDYRSPDEAARLLAGYAEPDGRVLDAGCGTGLSGHALVAAGFADIVGLDISGDSLAVAGRREVYRHLLRGNLQSVVLPFRDDSFDALTCVGVMTYIQNNSATLREFCRIVRPRGHIVFTCRDDLYRERDFASVLDGLAEDGDWRSLYQSPPSLYLPGNDAFAEDIKVIYFVYEVREAPHGLGRGRKSE